MNKLELLDAVRQMTAAGQVSDVEILDAVRNGHAARSAGIPATAPVEQNIRRSLSLSKALYFIGGVVILIGIIILVVQNWKAMGSALQLLVTLGVALATFVAGLILRGRPGVATASMVFTGISGIMFPIGAGVMLDLMGISLSSPSVHMMVAAALLLVFGVMLALMRDVVYAFFSILFGTWLYGAAIAWIMKSTGGYILHLTQYATMVLGIAYLFIAQPLRNASTYYYRRLSTVLSFFGLLGILGPVLTIGGMWDVLYPFIVFAVMFGSVYLHNGTYLKIGAFFLMVYLIKISAQYFSGSFGWPLALVLAGIMLMVVGYATYYLNNKYIKNA
jgi:hypothetical protein